MKLDRQTRIGAVLEFGVGIPLNLALGAALYYGVLPTPPGMESVTNRLVFSIQCSALPALMMLAGIWAVALGRATSKAIDPLAGEESPVLKIHIRYLSNTTEQLVLFVCSAAALSTFLGPETIRIIPTLALLFVLNRILFWVGYLRDPSYRGLGLSGTIYPISIMVLAAAYYALRLVVAGSLPA